MKTITFKTLSILLAAVILVAALPVAALAEEVSPRAVRPCIHIIESFFLDEYYNISSDEHLRITYMVESCVLCGLYFTEEEIEMCYEGHDFGEYDEEVDMSASCVCGEEIFW